NPVELGIILSADEYLSVGSILSNPRILRPFLDGSFHRPYSIGRAKAISSLLLDGPRPPTELLNLSYLSSNGCEPQRSSLSSDFRWGKSLDLKTRLTGTDLFPQQANANSPSRMVLRSISVILSNDPFPKTLPQSPILPLISSMNSLASV